MTRSTALFDDRFYVGDIGNGSFFEVFSCSVFSSCTKLKDEGRENKDWENKFFHIDFRFRLLLKNKRNDQMSLLYLISPLHNKDERRILYAHLDQSYPGLCISDAGDHFHLCSLSVFPGKKAKKHPFTIILSFVALSLHITRQKNFCNM